jgi:hypothetical protein
LDNHEPQAATLEPDELLRIKENAYRHALLQAWFTTALEQTKSVFTLGSAGVGLALTLLFSDNAKPIVSWVPAWLLLAAIAFAASSGLCIWVFRLNVKLVTRLANDQNESHENGLVGRANLASLTTFGAGLVLLTFAAIAQIWL